MRKYTTISNLQEAQEWAENNGYFSVRTDNMLLKISPNGEFVVEGYYTDDEGYEVWGEIQPESFSEFFPVRKKNRKVIQKNIITGKARVISYGEFRQYAAVAYTPGEIYIEKRTGHELLRPKWNSARKCWL